MLALSQGDSVWVHADIPEYLHGSEAHEVLGRVLMVITLAANRGVFFSVSVPAALAYREQHLIKRLWRIEGHVVDIGHGINNRLWTSNAPWVLAALQDFEGHGKMQSDEGDLHDKINICIHGQWNNMVADGSEELLGLVKWGYQQVQWGRGAHRRGSYKQYGHGCH